LFNLFFLDLGEKDVKEDIFDYFINFPEYDKMSQWIE
jgi:hypothetical protein